MTKQIVLITGCSKGGIGKKFNNSRNSKNRAYLSLFFLKKKKTRLCPFPKVC